MKSYQILESTSELKLRIFGRDFAQLLENALFAMFDSVTPRYTGSTKELTYDVTISALDREQLLIDFLSEALSLACAKHIAFFRVDFAKLTATSLKARLIGRAISGCAFEIKAVTYHGVAITKSNGGESVDIIFDI